LTVEIILRVNGTPPEYCTTSFGDQACTALR
jgi:hypothetical protein